MEPRHLTDGAAVRPRSPAEFLWELRVRGAARLDRVAFRPNRSTIWSITRNGTSLNLHEAYRSAPAAILDAFAVIVGGARGDARAASRAVREWPGLEAGLHAARQRSEASGTGEGSVTTCCGSPRQRAHVRAAYRHLNASRFAGALPADVPLRLSRRMTTALGHMLPGHDRARGRHVAEIALNVDLMLAGNGAERVDTLLHEMAHAADWLFEGGRGHGRSWRRWAEIAGCRPEMCRDEPLARRRRPREAVTRAPPLPVCLESPSE